MADEDGEDTGAQCHRDDVSQTILRSILKVNPNLQNPHARISLTLSTPTNAIIGEIDLASLEELGKS